MNGTGGRKTAEASTPKDIEDQLELTVADLRQEVERTLEERIQELKRDAQRKIERCAEDVAEGKAQLKEYRAILAGLEKESAEVRDRIRRHLENAGRTKAEIMKLVDLRNAELAMVRDHAGKLVRIREDAVLRTKALNRHLEAKFGLAAPLPEITTLEDGVQDALRETDLWSKVKDLLGPAETAQPAETEKPAEAEDGPDIRAGVFPGDKTPPGAGGDEELSPEEMHPIFEEDLETIFTEP
jgi:DNA repair exonuclease SbcCD ATPase subunit